MAASQTSTFQAAVQKIFDGWSVLQVAVENGFGGVDSSEKAVWMVGAIDQWFAQNKDLDPSEVADFLADILNQEFNTIADDGSLNVVSQSICECYSMIQRGKLEELGQRLEAIPHASKGHQQVHNESDGGDSSSGEESMDTQDPGPGCSSMNSMAPAKEQEEDVPTLVGTDRSVQKQTDEDDGWTVVTNNKKR